MVLSETKGTVLVRFLDDSPLLLFSAAVQGGGSNCRRSKERTSALREGDDGLRDVDTKPNRFDQRYTVFSRIEWDENCSVYGKTINAQQDGSAAGEEAAYEDTLNQARHRGSRQLYSHLGAMKTDCQEEPAVRARQRRIVSARGADTITQDIKAAARRFGASLVGIAECRDSWFYSHDAEGAPISIPQSLPWAVVMAIAMNPNELRRSPGMAASAESSVGYAKMAFAAASLAGFISHLGYNALAANNDTALSIPLAVDAGLGQLGRNGLLLTEQHGPCVRLSKVFTDLPLAVDRPPARLLHMRCESCRRCAAACPAGAISMVREPTGVAPGPSNRVDPLRHLVDPERCYAFWTENGTSCSSCIGVCPQTPISEST